MTQFLFSPPLICPPLTFYFYLIIFTQDTCTCVCLPLASIKHTHTQYVYVCVCPLRKWIRMRRKFTTAGPLLFFFVGAFGPLSRQVDSVVGRREGGIFYFIFWKPRSFGNTVKQFGVFICLSRIRVSSFARVSHCRCFEERILFKSQLALMALLFF